MQLERDSKLAKEMPLLPQGHMVNFIVGKTRSLLHSSNNETRRPFVSLRENIRSGGLYLMPASVVISSQN